MPSTAASPTLLGLPPELVVFVAILLCILLAAPLVSRVFGGSQRILKRASTLKKRLSQEAAGTAETGKPKAQQHGLRRQQGDASLPMLSVLLTHLPNISQLRARLERAGIETSAERYLAWNVGLFAVATLGFYILNISPVIAILLGLVVGLGIPHKIVNFRISSRVKQFLILFPDALDLIVRGLRAGLPVTESIKMVSREIDEPVGGVFRAIAEKMALGVPLEQTLYETAAKYRITEFDFFVTSLSLQRETGGNLSEILNNLSSALRQRTMMRLKIKAMSSEARASMYIIGSLPFLVMAALGVTSPDYLLPLINDFRGNIALAVAGGMLFTGIFIMLRMAKFEI